TDLREEERTELVEQFGRRYAAGDTVYVEGQEARECFLIEEGRIRIVKRVRSTERSLTVLGAGDLFGEDALIPRSRRSASAVALSDLAVLALRADTLVALMASNTDIARRLVEQLVRRLRDAEEQLENAMLRDQPSRVINTLIRLASSREATEEGFVLRISPVELASRAGLDVEAVKRVVQKLREGGYLRIADEQIVLPN